MRGKTAQKYGLSNYPLVVVIDRAGKIAFRTDLASGDRDLNGIYRKMVQNPQSVSEEKAVELIKQTLAEEIEMALKQKN